MFKKSLNFELTKVKVKSIFDSPKAIAHLNIGIEKIFSKIESYLAIFCEKPRLKKSRFSFFLVINESTFRRFVFPGFFILAYFSRLLIPDFPLTTLSFRKASPAVPCVTTAMSVDEVFILSKTRDDIEMMNFDFW